MASPTKLAEYLSCGLPVISSTVSKYWVNNDGMKYILSIDDADSLLDNLDVITNFILDSPREQISEYAKQYLSLDIDRTNFKKFIETYLM